ncbi:MAG: Glu-tRNA(Gln) amidotransferase subunit GatD [Nanoarchaeota archaeon]
MSGNAEPGDSVKVHTKEEIIVGTLLQRSQLLDKRAGKDILVLKLKNGYNIGIDKARIKKIELVKKNESDKKKAIALEHDPKLKNVLIISCGGTISSKIDYKTGGVYADYTAEDFVEMMPSLASIANLDAKKLLGKMSEDFLPADWKVIAKEVYDNYKKYDGFVITQGTDTLHYTSAALSFFLENLGKPAVFTAAQRSIDRGSSDAFMNLTCAVKAAAEMDAAGVFVCMHATTNDDFCYLHKGTKVRKMHSLRRDAFRSINDTPVAKIAYPTADITMLTDDLSARIQEDELDDLKLVNSFEENIAFIYFHPNMDPGIIDYHISKGIKGIVIAGTALGHVALEGKKSLLKKIESCKKHTIPVVMTSQCLYGRTDPLVYAGLRELSIGQDVIYAEDMLPETAYVKLGWVLKTLKKGESVRERMLRNVAGEINIKQDPEAFLN